MTTDHVLKDENLTARLRWLIVSRIAIVTFILAMAVSIQVKGTELSADIYLPHLYTVLTLTYLLSIVFYFLQNTFENIDLNIYIQGFSDVALVTALVYATGGIRSVYTAFYPLVIIYAVLFLGRRGGLIIASAGSIAYGLLINFEFYGVIRPMHRIALREFDFTAGYVFTRVFIHILSFYVISLLSSFVVEREKRARTLLAEKETAFDQLDLLHRSIIESVDAGILTINLRGSIKSFNTAAQKITGLSFREVENRDISAVFPDYLERGKQTEEGGLGKSRFEMAIGGKNDEDLMLGCSVSPLLDGNQKRIGDIVVFQDITSVKLLEETIEKSRRMAFIGEMAAGLAHEMRNPIASISGSVQLLKKELILSDTDQRLMEIILRGKDQLENFMSDFLVLARPSLGVRETFHVREAFDEVLESLRLTQDWNELIDVRMTLSDESIVYANRKEIRQIVWNLLINAVQAMPDGGRLDIAAQTDEEENGDTFIRISIADKGHGIEQNDLAKIFEPFYTTKEKGTGLGLAVVNKIVERNNGRIIVESSQGMGTTCTVWLPESNNG